MVTGSVERRGESGRVISTSFWTDVGDLETSSIMGLSTVVCGGSIAWGGMAKTGGGYVGFNPATWATVISQRNMNVCVRAFTLVQSE